MTTIENTTRPSNNSITRRKMLQSVAVVSASVVLPAGAAAQASGTPFATPPDVQAPSMDLLRVIDEHKWARELWGIAGWADGIELDAEIAALEAILAHPIETMEDMRTKASYLLSYDHDEFEAHMVEPLLASMAGSEVGARRQIADPDAEIIAAYAEWSRLYDLCAADDGDAYYDLFNQAEVALVSLTPHTPRGIAIQLLAFTSFGDFGELQNMLFDFAGRLMELAAIQPPSTYKKFEVPA